MNDLSPTIIAKSDQLNSDDLLSGPRTITVTKVSIMAEADQPVAIHFEGDNGKPYKICKSMRRVLVNCWGPDGNAYIGRSMTLYRDDKVVFGGMAVGGIRISHLSHIDRDVTMALTATRASRKPYTVKPLRIAAGSRPTAPPPAQDGFPGDRTPSTTREAPGEATQPGAGGAAMTLDERVKAFDRRISGDVTTTKLTSMWNAAAGLRGELDRADPEELQAMEDRFNARFAEVEDATKAEQF